MQQYDIFIVSLDPTVGAEIQKSRPCVVISPKVQRSHRRGAKVAEYSLSYLGDLCTANA